MSSWNYVKIKFEVVIGNCPKVYDFLAINPSLHDLDTETETCEDDRLVLKRRLAASAVEIEKQVSFGFDFTCFFQNVENCFLWMWNFTCTLQRMKCFP